MKLTAQQAAQFERDGFLVFPELFSQGEIDAHFAGRIFARCPCSGATAFFSRS